MTAAMNRISTDMAIMNQSMGWMGYDINVDTGRRLMVAVGDEADKRRFDALVMQAVVQQGFPRGLDMDAAVLDAYRIDKKKIRNRMKRQQTKALEDSACRQSVIDASY